MANNNLSSHSGASAAAAARMPSSSVMEVNTNNSNNNNNNNAADDDSVLDLAEQTQRPIDNALMQQRVNAWHPILDPVFVIVALFYFGVIMIPVGFKIDSIQKNTVELKETYDAYSENYNVDDTICGIGENYNENRTCYVNFTAPKFMAPPILIHYQLKNFYQNHRNYYKSKDAYQLLGQVGNQDSISAEGCDPLNKLGNITLNPCGLIANTLFNDFFTLESGNDAYGEKLVLIEEGIAWKSDVEYMYAQPDGFEYTECPADACDASCCREGDSCIGGLPYTDKMDGKCYRYVYPEDETTQYLYETYPDIISPIEGVTNEHFIVWMRIAAQPDFRKLYGWINQPVNEGEVITFRINSNYVVTRFQGSKTLVMATTSIFGGRNPYFAPVFIWVGVFCLIAGTFFTLKQTLRPRKLADPAYLHFKEE